MKILLIFVAYKNIAYMYEHYLQFSNIPCGDILNRIMKKEGVSQSQLAERSGILRQRICDYLTNRRRITVEASLNLEKALRIDIEGFFYRIQANHDIYTCLKKQAESCHPNLNCYRKALFWDTTIDNLNWDKNKEWIVRRVFEYGGEDEILETIRFYGKEEIQEVLMGINDERKADNRKNNMIKYLN